MNAGSKLLSGRKICVLTTGHLATSPRMTKAADAFAEAGGEVHVVTVSGTPWAIEADTDVRRRRPGAWTWHAVSDMPSTSPARIKAGLRRRLAISAARLVGPSRLPLTIAAAARERMYPEVAQATKGRRFDFIYGGGAGLMAPYLIATRTNTPFGVDLEDYHPADQPDTPHGRLYMHLASRIERDVLPRAAVRTAGSEEIAAAYRARYQLSFVAINNTFPVCHDTQSSTCDRGPLTLYWFSQTIGPDRGLEDVVAAAGSAGVPLELHVRGNADDNYLRSLMDMARAVAPKLAFVEHPPCLPDDVVASCARYDIGLAVETTRILNHRLCLSNKALAYVAAGNALVLTDTPGQRRLAAELGVGAFLYRSGESGDLANQLVRWSEDRDSLRAAKAATVAARARRWHWEHRNEKRLLVAAVAQAIASSGTAPE